MEKIGKIYFVLASVIMLAIVFVNNAESVEATHEAPAAADTTVTETYQIATASISAPSVVFEGEDFKLIVHGELEGGNGSEVTAYQVYENAEWSYTANHSVSVTSGTLIDGSGFNRGEVNRDYLLNKPAGTYKYTFVLGDRWGAHGWYDVGVDIEVIVGQTEYPLSFVPSQVQMFPNGAEKVMLQGKVTLDTESDGIDPALEGVALYLSTTISGVVYPIPDFNPILLTSTADGWTIDQFEKDRTGIQAFEIKRTGTPGVYSFHLVDTRTGLKAGDYSSVVFKIAIGNDVGAVNLTLTESNGKYSL